MLIGKTSEYYLKRTLASSKEVEFSIPDELKTYYDKNIEELFPIVIGCIGDVTSCIIRNGDVDELNKSKTELKFSANFFDSYVNINTTGENYNYFFLMASISYYLCDLVGNSLVMANKVDVLTLSISEYGFDILLYYLLKNEKLSDFTVDKQNPFYDSIENFKAISNRVLNFGEDLNYEFLYKLRNDVYNTGSPREILIVDSLIAVLILKCTYSIYKMLPEYSQIKKEDLIPVINGGHFVREFWPAQRAMCKEGFFNGQSGVIQMPTGERVIIVMGAVNVMKPRVSGTLNKYILCIA